MRVDILRKREPRKLIVNWEVVMNKTFFSYFYSQGITVTNLTKTATSHAEIIAQRHLRALSPRLKTLHITNYLRTPIDGATNVYIEELYCVLVQPCISAQTYNLLN